MALLLSSGDDGVLTFKLERNVAPRVHLKLTNSSTTTRAVFKVRTTQPMWYFVRPNQDILEPGTSVDLAFTLIETECRRFLDLHKAGNEESVDKHRFMVQGMPLEQSDFDTLSAIPADSPNRAVEVCLCLCLSVCLSAALYSSASN